MVRLVSSTGLDSLSSNISAGRLEIFLDNQWGTVCDDLFSGADEACCQLGFSEAVAFHNQINLG